MDVLRRLFGVEKPFIAMVHLLGLPGRPRHNVEGGIGRVVDAMAADLDALQRAEVDGVLFCNEHDIPYQLTVGHEVVAAMAAAIGQIRHAVRVPFGVDVLWDAGAALAVARATGASFVREVFTGVFESDMGLLAPDLGGLAGYRSMIGAADVALFANITPESSRSISGRTVAARARGAAYGGVDALLISGPQAGVAASLDDLREAVDAKPGVPVVANTGVTHENVGPVLQIADGVIVGTSLKAGGVTWNPIDYERAARMTALVRSVRSELAA